MIPLGFEPKTHSLEGCCSIQLSYGTRNRLQNYCFLSIIPNKNGIILDIQPFQPYFQLSGIHRHEEFLVAVCTLQIVVNGIHCLQGVHVGNILA